MRGQKPPIVLLLPRWRLQWYPPRPGQTLVQGARPGAEEEPELRESVRALAVPRRIPTRSGWAAAWLQGCAQGGGRATGRSRRSRRGAGGVCALPRPSLPAPAPAPAPLSPPRAPARALSPPSSPPRARPAPGISAAVAVQAADSSSPSPGRLSARSERAAPRSSAHRSRPVSPGPSRRQPRGVASPAHPPGRRGAGGGRDPSAPNPTPPEAQIQGSEMTHSKICIICKWFGHVKGPVLLIQNYRISTTGQEQDNQEEST
ncbi:uncharacterized protein LOC143443152 [Arvicanthis niloticus]|uniref:uncharacterized protein LOC143313368 n=1 Tax=Arvicanthis niloticus TaxID=61156 RepID=UPI00402B1480